MKRYFKNRNVGILLLLTLCTLSPCWGAESQDPTYSKRDTFYKVFYLSKNTKKTKKRVFTYVHTKCTLQTLEKSLHRNPLLLYESQRAKQAFHASNTTQTIGELLSKQHQATQKMLENSKNVHLPSGKTQFTKLPMKPKQTVKKGKKMQRSKTPPISKKPKQVSGKATTPPPTTNVKPINKPKTKSKGKKETSLETPKQTSKNSLVIPLEIKKDNLKPRVVPSQKKVSPSFVILAIGCIILGYAVYEASQGKKRQKVKS